MTSQNPLVIVPTYNEADNIDELLEKVFAHVPTVQVLFVDDNSVDGTRERIREWIGKRPGQVHVLERAGKLGLGTAYIAGFKWGLARAHDPIIEMDADLSHDPVELPKMLELLKAYPVAVGSRYVEGGGTMNWSFIRKCISRFGSFYGRTILGLKVRDLTGGFNGWSAKVLLAIKPDLVRSEGYSFQIELKYRAAAAGFVIKEFPIIFADRKAGQSKMSTGIVIEAIFRVWQIKRLVGVSLRSIKSAGLV